MRFRLRAVRTARLLAVFGVPAMLAAPAPRAAEPSSSPPPLPPGVVATVNGEPVRTAEVEDRLWREWGPVYTGYAIRREIVRAEAKKRGITVSPEELETFMTEYRNRFNAVSGRQPRDWELFIERFGLENLRERQRDEILSGKIGDDEAAKAVLTEDEKQRVMADLNRAAHKVHVRHVFIGHGPEYENRTEAQARARAEEVKAKLEAGMSWDEAATTYSDDVATRATGGDLGFFTRDQMVKPLEDAAFGADPKAQAILLVTVPDGFDVIQVLDREDNPPTEAGIAKAMEETLARKRDIVKMPGDWYPRVEKQYATVTEMPYERAPAR